MTTVPVYVRKGYSREQRPSFRVREELSMVTQDDACPVVDPCPACNEADLVRKGQKEVCPNCHYQQPCCQP